MITNFEKETKPLTDEELKIVAILIKGFSARTKENPIKGPDIIQKLNVNAFEITQGKFTERRLRKLTNYIRTNGLIPLMATNEGYYVSYDKKEIMQQIISLRDRADAIMSSTIGLEKFLIR